MARRRPASWPGDQGRARSPWIARYDNVPMAPRRREVDPAYCHTRHVPLNARSRVSRCGLRYGHGPGHGSRTPAFCDACDLARNAEAGIVGASFQLARQCRSRTIRLSERSCVLPAGGGRGNSRKMGGGGFRAHPSQSASSCNRIRVHPCPIFRGGWGRCVSAPLRLCVFWVGGGSAPI